MVCPGPHQLRFCWRPTAAGPGSRTDVLSVLWSSSRKSEIIYVGSTRWASVCPRFCFCLSFGSDLCPWNFSQGEPTDHCLYVALRCDRICSRWKVSPPVERQAAHSHTDKMLRCLLYRRSHLSPGSSTAPAGVSTIVERSGRNPLFAQEKASVAYSFCRSWFETMYYSQEINGQASQDDTVASFSSQSLSRNILWSNRTSSQEEKGKIGSCF